ncbi:hypothetical protein N9051_01710 [Akkermansiaceae bacterium]|nr:hypothetical protein [Akkermansiaceae bacterium]
MDRSENPVGSNPDDDEKDYESGKDEESQFGRIGFYNISDEDV